MSLHTSLPFISLKIFIATFFCFFLKTPKTVAQTNLVPNGSFENYKELYCGWLNTDLQLASFTYNWTAPTAGTFDVYSTLVDPSCWNYANGSTYTDPFECVLGKQAPHTGNFMAGFYSMGSANYREYLQVQFSEPLQKGKKYCLSFWVSCADSADIATNNIGAALSNINIDVNNNFPLALTPVINATETLNDTQNWTEIKGTFTADSAYNYLLIGNFLSQFQTTVQEMPAECHPNFSYYFVDDVSLTEIPNNIIIEKNIYGCKNDVFDINATIGDQHWWKIKGNFNDTIGTGATLSVTPQFTTSYVVITKYCNAVVKDTVTVFVANPPTFSLPNDTTLCLNTPFTIKAQNINPAWQLQWSTADTFPQITINEEGTYWLKAKNENECSHTDTINITYTQGVSPKWKGKDTLLCFEDNNILNAYNPLLTNYLWNNETTTPTIAIDQKGWQYVSATDVYGCTYSDSIQTLLKHCSCKVILPTAFSPNNDGTNDELKLIYNCTPNNFRWIIYNRWGKSVFSTTNPAETWDGSNTFANTNTPCDMGTYPYYISYNHPETNKLIQLKGNISLIR